MEKKILLVMLIFMFVSINNLLAQNNDMKARIEYEDAEQAYQNKEYEKTIKHLSEAEKYLGYWTNRISLLKIQALNNIVDLNATDYRWNSNVSELHFQVKEYMKYAEKNPDKVDLDRIREIYKIEKLVDYAKQVKECREMPEYQKAEEALSIKDYPVMIDWYKKAAAKNNLVAMALLGYSYYNGSYGLAQDYGEALKWCKQAAELENRSAMVNLGNIYIRGKGVQKNVEEGLLWYKKAAELGSTAALNILGHLYLEGQGVNSDENEALKWFVKAGESGSAPDALQVASMYYYSDVAKAVPKDYEKALFWADKTLVAANKSNVNHFKSKALYLKGRIYQTQKNNVKAIQAYTEAANYQDMNAIVRLGDIYYEGKITTKNNNEAVKWYEMSNGGYYRVSILLAELYGYTDINTDVKKSIDKALHWCNLAVRNAADDKSKAQSYYMLGRLQRAKKDYVEAVASFTDASKYGNKQANYQLAEMYENGLGVEKSKKKAKEWRNK